MKRALGTLQMAAIAAFAAVAPAEAGTSGAVYDMSAMLGQPHPFSAPYRPAPPPAVREPIRAAAAQPAPAPKAAVAPARKEPPQVAASGSGGSEGWNGFLSEIRGGAFYNDFGPFSHQKEGGVMANLELLFVSPEFLDIIWSPRPHLGTSYNTGGDTNVPVYFGLSWEWDFADDFMWGFSLGGAYHDGYTDANSAPTDRKELGCSILFRESLKLGYRFDKHHSLMAHFDHISNAKLCDTNEGLESLGLQYGYRF